MENLGDLIVERFIQRRDIKAVQFSSGAYVPDRELKNRATQEPDPGQFGPYGFFGRHLQQHLEGKATYGHYLIDSDDMARSFCFDIDLKTEGYWVPITQWDGVQPEAEWEASQQPVFFNPRTAWLDRSHPGRPWIKYQMGMLARRLCSEIQTKIGDLEMYVGSAASYSGHKGIHVYGFVKPMPAIQVRAAAQWIIDGTKDWQLSKGYYDYKLQDPSLGYPNFNLEIYPKQESLEGKDLGNLVRLPLGKNLKNPVDPTFFIDLKTPVADLVPHSDPVGLLTSGNPYF